MISKWDELRVILSCYNINETTVARAVKEYIIQTGDSDNKDMLMKELDEYIEMSQKGN